MNQKVDPARRFAVLFVDDEEQALKYFDRAFVKHFRILTASSAEKAWQLINDPVNNIGVLITDHRMPQQTGVDLLEKARHTHPGIVRILTTAYADVDNAIQAVNEGAIFRYVTKPWDIRDLLGVLRTAMDYFLVQRERDLLLKEKLSALHRILVLDRIRSLYVFAKGLGGQFKNAPAALRRYVELADLQPSEIPSGWHVDWEDVWSVGPKETKAAGELVGEVAGWLNGSQSPQTLSVEELIRHASQGNSVLKRYTVQTSDRTPQIVAGESLLRNALAALASRLLSVAGSNASGNMLLEGHSLNGQPSVHLCCSVSGQAMDANRKAALFSAVRPGQPVDAQSAHCLAAVFAIHHLSGGIDFSTNPQNESQLDIYLPCHPENVPPIATDDDWIDDVFTRMEDPNG
ncbi:MAG: response regulator [Phycisphaerales bacterium]